LNFLVTNNVAKIQVGQAQYTAMCNAQGGIVDDLIIYKRAPERFFVVVNASNTDKDFAHMQGVQKQYKGGSGRFTLVNESAKFTQIALQGRQASRILAPLTSVSLEGMKNYWFGEGTVLGKIPAIVARTGYTGEDGFEIYVPWEKGPEVWRALLEAG